MCLYIDYVLITKDQSTEGHRWFLACTLSPGILQERTYQLLRWCIYASDLIKTRLPWKISFGVRIGGGRKSTVLHRHGRTQE